MGILQVMERPRQYASFVDQDGLWKKVIGDLFEEFVQFFLPDFHAEVDFSKPIDFLDQELYKIVQDRRKGLNRADKLVKVQLKNGREQWVLVHVEVQGKDEADFAKRMFRYFYRIYDKYNQDIIALALFTDTSNHSTDTFEYVYFGTRLTYTFNKYVLSQFDVEQLKVSPNLFSKALLAACYFNETKRDAQRRFAYKEALLKEVALLKDYSDEEVNALFYFIEYLLALPEDLSKQLNEEIVTFIQKEEFQMVQLRREDLSPILASIADMMEKEMMKQGIEKGIEQGIEKGIEKGMEQGIEKGIEQGIEQGIASATEKFVRKALMKQISVADIADITGLTEEQILAIQKKYNI